MEYLEIVDWDIHQTYRKDRGTPPWIKVHRTLLSSQHWSELSDSEKGQLVSIWLIGADKKGKIPADPCILRKVCLLDKVPNTNKFISLGYLASVGCQDDNHLPTINGNLDAPETETETETEKHFAQKKDFAQCRERFERIWLDYPEKKGKERAWPKFKKQVGTEKDFEDIQKALVNYKSDVENKRATTQPELNWQHGSTWFNQNWKDYVEMAKPETWAEKKKREIEESE